MAAQSVLPLSQSIVHKTACKDNVGVPRPSLHTKEQHKWEEAKAILFMLCRSETQVYCITFAIVHSE